MNSYQRKLAWLRSKSQRKQQRSGSFQLIRFGQIPLLHKVRRRKIASEAKKYDPFTHCFVLFAFLAAAFVSICRLQQYKVLGGYFQPLSRFLGLNFA
jgi:hypothetical protein